MKKTLEDLFLDSLAELCSAESQQARALPKMAKAATHEDLQEALERYFKETDSQMQKLEEVFERLEAKPRIKKCVTMTGLIREAEEIIAEDRKSPAINAALIYATQKAAHYKIASYGTLRDWARHLGEDDVADLMDDILEKEKNADASLTELAETHCNEAAISEEKKYAMEYAADWAR